MSSGLDIALGFGFSMGLGIKQAKVILDGR